MKRAVTSTAVEIAGPAGRIEAALDEVGDAAVAVAVICHPHPLQLGTMQNKVVTTLARTFANLGAIAVRFNFRGVGASAGTHADGEGERDDVLAVIEWSRARWPGLHVYLGGFSFGAAMALGVAARVAPRGLVTVAPPVARLPVDFEPPQCPWLLVHGSADDVVAAAPVVKWANALAIPPRVVLADGVGHYFHGHLNALADAVTEFFGPDFELKG
ncbi:MAG: alpha/beta hydrolase [Gammaproteobacteria bacterium]